MRALPRALIWAVSSQIPASYRDSDGHWFGLTQQGGMFYVSKDLDNPPMTYEDLADPAYAGMICHRDGQHPYNNALRLPDRQPRR